MRSIAPMGLMAIAFILLPAAYAAASGQGGDFEACTSRQAELAPKAAAFDGERMIKRLIEADLKRAKREEAEGDADECLEALDHAMKLLRGEY